MEKYDPTIDYQAIKKMFETIDADKSGKISLEGN